MKGLELAFYIGINPSEFWEMTPLELRITIKGYIERKKAEVEYQKTSSVEQAYLISRWVWQKKVSQSDLDKAIGKKAEKKIMTDDEMLKQVMALNAMFGGEIINE